MCCASKYFIVLIKRGKRYTIQKVFFFFTASVIVVRDSKEVAFIAYALYTVVVL